MPSTRSSITSNGKSDTPAIVSRKVENSFVFLMKDEIFKSDSEPIIVSLVHPRLKKKTMFMIDGSNKKMYEVSTFDEPYHSWFIGNTVKSDGKMQVMTPFDPIFLVLPQLREQCIKNAVPFEDLIGAASDEQLKYIMECVDDLSCVADLKGSVELKAYKYNEEKTLDWLEKKVKRVARVLKDKKVHVKPGAAAETFVTSLKDTENTDDELYIKYAHGMVSEYLQDDLSALLEKRFDFRPEVIEQLSIKRKSQLQDAEETHKDEEDSENDIKKRKTEGSGVFASKIISPQNPKPSKPAALSTKEKSRQKAASGTVSISKFFTKK